MYEFMSAPNAKPESAAEIKKTDSSTLARVIIGCFLCIETHSFDNFQMY